MTILKLMPDAYTDQNLPGHNFGDKINLRLRSSSGHNERIFIAVPRIPADTTVESALLYFTLASTWNGSNTVTAERIIQKWAENKVTSTSQPDVSGSHAATATVTGGAKGDVYSIDVTSLMQDCADGDTWYGIRLTVSSSAERMIYSSEAGSLSRPYLDVTYHFPSDPPYALRPDGSHAVSFDNPLLAWTSATPQAVQVQIDPDGTFDTPLYDSALDDAADINGWILQDNTSYDLAEASDPPGLADDTQYQWRVRVKPASGIPTDWSDPAVFERRSLGTVVIDEPTSDGDTVEETTPPIIFELDGRTQTGFEWALFEDGVVVSVDGVGDFQTSTDTTFTIPQGLITKQGVDYMVRVRVDDDFTREGLGGDPQFAEASRTFQYDAASGITEATNLVASTVDGHVRLEWDRASAPDFFAVVVDGVTVLDLIPSADLLVDTDHYAVDYYSARPQAVHEYAIQTVTMVTGVAKHSDTPPTIDHTFQPIGVWLSDPDDGTSVLLLNTEVETSIGESGTTYFVLDRQDPVRVVDVLRGLEGTVTGQLIAANGHDIADLHGDFLELKYRSPKTLRLTWGYRNIPVEIGEVSDSLLDSIEESYATQFDFWQVGEFDLSLWGAVT